MPKKKLQNRIDSLFAELKEAQQDIERLPEKTVDAEAEPRLVVDETHALPAEKAIEHKTRPPKKVKVAPEKTGLESHARTSHLPRERTKNLDQPTRRLRTVPIRPTDGGGILKRPTTSVGEQSLRMGKPIFRKAQFDQSSGLQGSAVMAVPFPIREQRKALLEILDDTPGREWDVDEQRMVEQVTDQLSLALENAYLFQETQNALAEAEALYGITRTAVKSLKLEEILQEMLEKILAAVNQDAGIISVFNESSMKLEILAHHQIPQVIIKQLIAQNLTGSLCERIFHTDGVITIQDVRDTLPNVLLDSLRGVNFKEWMDTGFFSIQGVAIQSKGKVLGSLCTFGTKPWLHLEDTASLLLTACQQIGIAIENARLFEDEQRRRRIADALRELALVVGSSLNLEEIPALMLDQLVNLIEFDQAEIELVQNEMRRLVARRLGDKNSRALAFDGETCFPIHEDKFAFEAYRLRKPVIINKSSEHQDGKDTQLENGKWHSLMYVPIVAAQDVLGFVILRSTKPDLYSHETSDLAIAFASQASVAIRNANLFEQVESTLAETDRLYLASTALNAVQSYADVLEIMQHSTVIGSPSAIFSAVHLFDSAWVVGRPPEKLFSVAEWFTYSLQANPGVFAEDPLYKLDDAISIYSSYLNPDQIVVLHDRELNRESAEKAYHWYVEILEAITVMFIPLLVGGHWIGIIEVCFSDELKLSQTETRSLSALASQAAVAIQNIRLLEETRRRAAQLKTAAEIARDTSATLNLDELLNRAVSLICQRYGYYHASIFLIDASGRNAVVRAASGVSSDDMLASQYRLVVGSNSIVGQVSLTGKPLVNNDISHNTPHLQNPMFPATRSEMAIALKIGRRDTQEIKKSTSDYIGTEERIIGVLDVQSEIPNAFFPDDIAVLQVLVDQLAVAVDNAKAYEVTQNAIAETRKRVQEISTLYDVSQTLSSTAMQSSEIAYSIVEKYVSILPVDRASLFLYDQEFENLQVIAVAFPTDRKSDTAGAELVSLNRLPKQKIPLSEYIAVERVMQNLQPMILGRGDDLFPNLGNLPDMDDPLLAVELIHHLSQSLMLVPLAAKGRSIGIVQLESRKHVNSFVADTGQTNLVMTVANAAAVALENARLYEEQIETSEKLRELDKLKSQFLANMSHELRTPLNSIIGFSRVILKGIDGPISENQSQDLQAIHNAGTHLLKLINDVLDISKIEAGKMELAFDDAVDIGELINSAMSTAVGLTKDKPIKLERYIEPDLPSVRADPTRIRQVLINFLSNAAKFTDQGSIIVRAVRGLSPDSKDGQQSPEIVVSVTDTGPGISLQDQAKLFRPFSQVDSSPTRKVGGTGLGLSISRLLIELHNGRIGVDSKEGQGSTFYFALPIASSEVEEPGIDMPVSSGDNRTVLIIDDDPQIIKLYERYLKEHGYFVVHETDPTRAVQAVRQHQPFAITLDVMMPRRDGWQVLEDLKQEADTRQIPVIICSILEDQGKGLSMGAVDYLTKPILEDDLVDALQRLNRAGDIQNILVIDDDPNVLRLIEKVLATSTNFVVRTAQGGAEGLVEIQTRPPQVVILDLFMPEVDGFTVLEMMRQDVVLRDIPVIIFTAGDLTEQQRESLNKLSMDLLYKSEFKESDLMERIQKAIQRFEP